MTGGSLRDEQADRARPCECRSYENIDVCGMPFISHYRCEQHRDLPSVTRAWAVLRSAF